jgi:RNA polymerase sigma-70 factor (ECF subfamily)
MRTWDTATAPVNDLAHLNEAVAPLVSRARAGDRAALEEMLRRAHAVVHRWALVATGDPDDAEDVTQEVLVRLHTAIRRYRGRSQFSTWLYQVTRNAALDHRRREVRRLARRAPIEAADRQREHPEDRQLGGIAAGRIAAVVRRFLVTLPERQRQVFDLVDLQDVPQAEAASLLGMKPATARVHLFKARRALREHLTERHAALVEDRP